MPATTALEAGVAARCGATPCAIEVLAQQRGRAPGQEQPVFAGPQGRSGAFGAIRPLANVPQHPMQNDDRCCRRQQEFQILFGLRPAVLAGEVDGGILAAPGDPPIPHPTAMPESPVTPVSRQD